MERICSHGAASEGLFFGSLFRFREGNATKMIWIHVLEIPYNINIYQFDPIWPEKNHFYGRCGKTTIFKWIITLLARQNHMIAEIEGLMVACLAEICGTTGEDSVVSLRWAAASYKWGCRTYKWRKIK